MDRAEYRNTVPGTVSGTVSRFEVREAVWQTETERIRVRFKFHGAQGDYFFLVEAEFHERGYPFY